MKRAFLFGLMCQLVIVGVIFLFLGDQMLPMTRPPWIGVIAILFAGVSGVLAWRSRPHPSWPVAIGLWVAGFLALFVAIPLFELAAVLVIAVISN